MCKMCSVPDRKNVKTACVRSSKENKKPTQSNLLFSFFILKIIHLNISNIHLNQYLDSIKTC